MKDRVIDISNWRIQEGDKNRDTFLLSSTTRTRDPVGFGFGFPWDSRDAFGGEWTFGWQEIGT
jgi:hypothetical protein